MTLIEIRSATITSKGQIAIPKDVRNLKGFKEGSKVSIIAYNDRIEIRPLQQLREKLDVTYASEKVLSKDWLLKEEDEAWKDL
ncbi:AbrB/MazE/SpoVT family DNA-binding domain-containing protein [archaeon]|jgi:AbrB family looped-hinge helix DNA binding protein|nr:AbrB/MazE/SpoVT family DNA-binding domain-containing protein [Candidatus Woesearchaeota archaeon]MBT3463367.1 AbrB/MazE/SpoVT family DNA-binding domain-containing protein [archaeon]MBT4352038.1 AbrB/MazE/SpoVT family DNA-binding domain-containing protein [archaeon]MBT4648022.1 AbrB/MazE/SpoVT family DNA-binding domain-containing protein [archaeon]MBT7392363.1 AbrB/MazE/SpoVT family DNA-binding domain-containing protein [archaeon]